MQYVSSVDPRTYGMPHISQFRANKWAHIRAFRESTDIIKEKCAGHGIAILHGLKYLALIVSVTDPPGVLALVVMVEGDTDNCMWSLFEVQFGVASNMEGRLKWEPRARSPEGE